MIRMARSCLGVTACCLFLASCAQVQQLQKSSGIGSEEDAQMLQAGLGLFQEVPQPREIAMGQEMAAALLGAADLSDREDLQRYVNQVGLWVALQSERSDLPWRFGVLDTPALNAFAAPGGYVFVTRGLLRVLQSEAELAGVLAHEIAHVLRRHHLKAMQQDQALALMSELGTRAVDHAGHGDVVEALPADLKARIANAAKGLYARGLNRADEYEADTVATVLMARAGYDPIAFTSVLHKFAALNPAESELHLMFETHPSPTSRLDHLAELWETRFGRGGYAELAGRYNRHSP